MSSSSDDDDIPLSALAKNGSSKRSRPDDDESEEAEFDDEASAHEPADEEEDIDEFIVDDEDEDDEDGDYASDDSDDIPLSALKSPPKKKAKPVAKSKAKATKKAAPKKKATTATKKKKSTSTSTKKSSAKSTSAAPSNYVSASTELYANCEKGKLIQSLLARWWYVYDWPDPACLLNPPPKGYDELDGFPGVYICTSGDNVGDLKDVRDKTKAPSFQNFYKKSSEELRDDLLKAIEKQKAALIKAEGEGTSTEKELRALEKWATKLNCSKADKDAAKVLKAARLT